jgi:carboxymethylenebutenolidase
LGQYSTIMARDGHELQAWLEAAAGHPRGAVVLLQEIFGVNGHIRALAGDFAAQGYTVIAPCLFDRIRRGIELGYSQAEVQEGAGYRAQLKPETTMKDIAAAAAVVRHSGRTATVGYCWGGTLSYLAACQLPVSCAVVYYGKVASYLEQKPRCPVLYHFGGQDQSIPTADVELTRAATQPPSVLHLYDDAGHGFNCDQRASYNPQAAALARTRTLEFLGRYLAGDNAAKE